MLCSKPFRIGLSEYGCGQCHICRINHRRLWTNRIMLESLSHDASLFCTLTYDEEHYPNDGSISRTEAQRFIKRARYYAGHNLRYFICGEYGARTSRAHYHAILFGTSSSDVVSQSWKSGYVHIGNLTPASAAYCCAYVTKKIAGNARTDGKEPEFALQSRKPGLGRKAVEELVPFFQTREGAKILSETGDVPSWIRWQGKKWPIGRYLKSVLRAELGLDHTSISNRNVASAAGQKLALIEEIGLDAFELTRRQHSYNAISKLKILETKETL